MKFKAQSAVEYLMSYGWMLLVVAVVGGAVFSVVGDQGIESVSGFTGSNVQVSDFGLTSDSLQFVLRNGGAEEIEIEKVKVSDSSTGVTREIGSLKSLEVGGSENVELKGVERSGGSESHDVEVVYSTGGLSNLSVSGSVTGGFSVFNRVDLTGASFNRSKDELSIEVRNTGSSAADSVGYNVSGNGSSFTGSLSGLGSGESGEISVSVDETYPLESVSLDAEGSQFVDSSSGLQCTPTKGLVGYWPFNDEQTTKESSADLSKHKNNANLGDIKIVDGPVGEAFRLDAQEVSVSSDHAYNYSNHTLLFWLKPVGPHSGTWGDKVIVIGDNPTGQRRPLVAFHRTVKNSLHWKVSDKAGENNGIDNTATKTSRGKWDFWAAKYNGTKMVSYINGMKDTTDNVEGPIDATKTQIVMGSGGREIALDEVRVYNRSLSQSEIQRLYQVRSKDWAVSGCNLTG